MTIKAIFFDLDGTLVDSNEHHVASWSKVFAEEGHAVAADAIRAQIGKGADNLVPALLPGSDEALAERLSKRHGAIFTADHIDRIRPFPHAHDLLARLAGAGLRLVFASSASADDLDHYRTLLDADAYLDESTSADEVERSKPDGDIFAAALAKVAPIGADEVLVIGDTPYDVEAAARCGIATIAVRSGGFADADLLDAGATALFDDVAAILAGLEAGRIDLDRLNR
jgi:HAD superfamily hydrolase (TIGR01549 family)